MNLLPSRSRVLSAPMLRHATALRHVAVLRHVIGRRHVLRGFAVLGLTALMAACSTAPSKPIFPEITFDGQPKLTFAANAVQTVQEYQPSAEPPHIELTVPQSPVLVAQRWARDRVLVDNSQPYSVVVTIKKASVTEEDLRKYYDENSSRYGVPEERRASHILIKSERSAHAEERAKSKAKAE